MCCFLKKCCFRLFPACDSAVQEQFPAFCHVQITVPDIAARRCLESHCFQLGFHVPDYDERQPYTHRNQNRDPNQRKRLFRQIVRIIGVTGSFLRDEIIFAVQSAMAAVGAVAITQFQLYLVEPWRVHPDCYIKFTIISIPSLKLSFKQKYTDTFLFCPHQKPPN